MNSYFSELTQQNGMLCRNRLPFKTCLCHVSGANHPKFDIKFKFILWKLLFIAVETVISIILVVLLND